MPRENVTSKFCTFWIPNVAHNDFQIREDVVSKNKIPGNKGSHYNLKSDITKDRKTNTFSIRLTVVEVSAKNDQTSYNVHLESVDSCVSGLLEFEYKLNNHEHNKFKKVIHHVYRLVILHFHQHIYHDPENEGVPQTYFSDKKCSLDVEDNDALYFYLTQIHRLVSEQVEMIHDMAPTSGFEKDDGNVGLTQTELDRKRHGLEIFYKKCENLRGQMPFFHSLLNSPANKSCHVLSIKATTDKEKDLHTIAHNIVNLSNSIINLFEKSKTAFYIRNINTSYDIQSNIKMLASEINSTASKNKELIESVDKSNKLSSKLGWLSLGISIILGAISSWLGILGLRDKPLSESNVKAVSSQIVNDISEIKQLQVSKPTKEKISKQSNRK